MLCSMEWGVFIFFAGGRRVVDPRNQQRRGGGRATTSDRTMAPNLPTPAPLPRPFPALRCAAGWVLIMTAFVFFLVPETKGVPLEEIYTLFAKHPVWRRVIGEEVAAATLSREAANSGSFTVGKAEKGAVTPTAGVADNGSEAPKGECMCGCGCGAEPSRSVCGGTWGAG